MPQENSLKGTDRRTDFKLLCIIDILINITNDIVIILNISKAIFVYRQVLVHYIFVNYDQINQPRKCFQFPKF